MTLAIWDRIRQTAEGAVSTGQSLWHRYGQPGNALRQVVGLPGQILDHVQGAPTGNVRTDALTNRVPGLNPPAEPSGLLARGAALRDRVTGPVSRLLDGQPVAHGSPAREMTRGLRDTFNTVGSGLSVLGAVATGGSAINHFARGRMALHTDRGVAMTHFGEGVADLAGAIPGPIGTVASLGRFAHDRISAHYGGPTLGQRIGHSGGRTDISDLVASSRVDRGDLGVHAPTSADSYARRLQAQDEVRVQAQIGVEQERRRAIADEISRRPVDPMTRDNEATRIAGGTAPGFTPLSSQGVGPAGRGEVGAEFRL